MIYQKSGYLLADAHGYFTHEGHYVAQADTTAPARLRTESETGDVSLQERQFIEYLEQVLFVIYFIFIYLFINTPVVHRVSGAGI